MSRGSVTLLEIALHIKAYRCKWKEWGSGKKERKVPSPAGVRSVLNSKRCFRSLDWLSKPSGVLSARSVHVISAFIKLLL